MPAGAAPELRERAGAWGRSIVEDTAPWTELSERLTLLLTCPPEPDWAGAEGIPFAAWLLLDAAAARTLPPELRSPLVEHGTLTLSLGEGGYSVFVVDALTRLLDGTARRALEARWTVRNAVALHDPLRRHEELAAAANRLPAASPARIVRGLYLQVTAALHAAAAPDVVTLGEAGAAVARMACVLEEGVHPPVAWLLAAAKHTSLGTRVATWLDDLGPAAGGDAAAMRRITAGRDAVRSAVRAAIRPDFGATDWFRAPEGYALRAPR